WIDGRSGELGMGWDGHADSVLEGGYIHVIFVGPISETESIMERQQIVTVEEEDDLVLDSLLAANCSIERDVEPIEPRDHAADRTVPSQKRGALAAQRSAPLIVCAEEDSSGSGRCGGLYPPTYVTPAPHRPGDHLRRSMNGAEVPPRSILRKTSSYASFPEAGEKTSPAGRKSRRTFLPRA
ncbi:hypothetical protein THAOC_27171, partial [Thalassiosira oceanica]